MTYFESWRSLSARIRAFTEAANLYARFQQSNNADSYGGAKYLGTLMQTWGKSYSQARGVFDGCIHCEILIRSCKSR